MVDLGYLTQVSILLQAQRSLFVDLGNLELLNSLKFRDEKLEPDM